MSRRSPTAVAVPAERDHPSGATATRSTGPGRGGGATVLLGLLCVVAAMVLALGWWWQHGAARPPAPTASQAVSSVAARESGGREAARLAERVLSYDHRGFDAEVERTRGALAPSFRQQYARTMAGVREQVLAEQVSLRATAREAAVTSASPDRVVALVFLDQVTSSPLTPTRRVDQVRVLVTVARDGGEWRVSRMDAF